MNNKMMKRMTFFTASLFASAFILDESVVYAEESLQNVEKYVKKVEQTKQPHDIKKAKELLKQLPSSNEKDEWQATLHLIESIHNKYGEFQKRSKQLRQKMSERNYTEESLQRVEQQLTRSERILQENKSQLWTKDTEYYIQKQIDQLTTLENELVQGEGPKFVPTKETNQTVTLDLSPTIKTLEPMKKVGGGLLGLDIGVLDLGLLSASQIHKIDEKNRHSFTVPKGHMWELEAAVSMHSILGGHAFKVHLFKENALGNYEKIATYEESSGAFLGIAKEAHIDLGRLEEGNYEVILELGAGLSVVQVVPFSLVNIVDYDFTQLLNEKSIARGNVLKGQDLGANGDARVSTVEVNGKPYSVAKEGDTKIQGAYGHLHIAADGTYTYIPAAVRNYIGEVETFDFTIKNQVNKKEAKGQLHIRIDERSVLWNDEKFDEKGRVVEANDLYYKTTALPMIHEKEVIPYQKVRERKLSKRALVTPFIHVRDKATIIDFAVVGSKGSTRIQTDIELVASSGEVIAKLHNVMVYPNRPNLQQFRNVPQGEYYIRIPKNPSFKGSIYIEGLQTGKAKNPYFVQSMKWGSYQQGEFQSIADDLIVSPKNFMSKDQTKTKIYIEGFKTVWNDKEDKREVVGKEKAYVPFDGSEKVIAGEHGFLKMTGNGQFTYQPHQEIHTYGQIDEFRYKLVHWSGKEAEAVMRFEMPRQQETSTNDDIIVGTKELPIIEGKGGSDTLVYPVYDQKSPTGGNDFTRWVDFSYGMITTKRDADRIDLRELFTLERPVYEEKEGQRVVTHYEKVRPHLNKEKMEDFLQIRREGQSFILYVDRDGRDGQFEWTPLLQLEGENMPPALQLKEMVENGQIIIP